MEDSSVARHRNFVFVSGELSSAAGKMKGGLCRGSIIRKAGIKPCCANFDWQKLLRRRRANFG